MPAHASNDRGVRGEGRARPVAGCSEVCSQVHCWYSADLIECQLIGEICI